jgi:hypothetical protein
MVKNSRLSRLSLTTIETKKSSHFLSARLLQLIDQFAEDLVTHLDQTSPFKIRSDQLKHEDAYLEQVLAEMDIEQMMREMEFRQLKGLQIIKQWDEDDKLGDETTARDNQEVEHILSMF